MVRTSGLRLPGAKWDPLLLILLPVAIWAALRLPAMHTMEFTDAHFYFAYAQNFTELVERYGMQYYAVRFGSIFPEWLFSQVFGPIGGFLMLREVLSACVCLALYRFFSLRFGRRAGWIGALAWMLNPGVLTMMLSPYVSSTAVPMAFLGLLLLFPDGEGPEMGWRMRSGALRALVAGGLFAMAASANLFAGFIIFFGGFAWAILSWRRRVIYQLLEMVFVMAGGAVVLGVAAFAYWRLFDMPWILNPTMETILSLNAGGAQQWARPMQQWMVDSPHNFAPIILIVLGGALWIRLRTRTLLAGLVFLGGMTGLYWFLELFRGGYSLSFGIYLAFLLPPFCLLLAGCVIEGVRLSKDLPNGRHFAAFGLLMAFAAIYFAYCPAVEFRPVVLLWIVVVAVLSVGFLFTRFAHIELFLGIGLALTLVPLSKWYNYASWREKPSAVEASLLGMKISNFVPKVKEDFRRVIFWYPEREPKTLELIQSAQLDWLSRPASKEGAEKFPWVSEQVADAFDDWQTGAVVVFDRKESSEVDKALQALERSGRSFRVSRRETLASGDTTVDLAVVEPVRAEVSEFEPVPVVWKVEEGAEVLADPSGTKFETLNQRWRNEIRAGLKFEEPFTERKILRIRMRVDTGRVGVLLIGRKQVGGALAETTVPHGEHMVDIFFPIEVGQYPLRIVVRNDWVNGRVSRGAVESVAMGRKPSFFTRFTPGVTVRPLLRH